MVVVKCSGGSEKEGRKFIKEDRIQGKGRTVVDTEDGDASQIHVKKFENY